MLFLIPGATHIQTYYVPEYVDQAVDKLKSFLENIYKNNMNKIMKATIISLFIIIFATQVSFAQTSDAEKEIIDLSKQKWEWMADKNVDALSKLFHAKAEFVHMGGAWGY